MQHHHIEVTKTARYATLGELTEKTTNVWLVCHGYGQLAEFFVKKFEVLDLEKHFIVAPEGLSRFYLKDMSGRVGATWMTREDRLHEIKDLLNYLNLVYQKIVSSSPIPFENLKVHLLGFSQGAVTAVRWAFDKKIKFDELIIWAGAFPPDVDYDLKEEVLGNKPIYFVYGTQDELIQEGVFKNQLQEIEIKKIKVEIMTFEGTHELNEEIILRLANKE